MSSVSMLQAILVFSFGSSVDQVPDRLAEFEALTMRYGAEPNEDALSDAIKKAVLVRSCPEPLKTHLQMNLQAYQGYSSIRNAVQSYTEAKRTWRPETVQASSSTDMEVDAVGKDGYIGKSKGGKGKSKNSNGDEWLHLRQARTWTERLLVQGHERKQRKGQVQRKRETERQRQGQEQSSH